VVGSLRDEASTGCDMKLGSSVDALEQFVEIVLYGRHGRDDRRRTEAVRHEREVSEMALDVGVERRGGRRQTVSGGQQRPSTER